jgi:protein kinase A/non-specific serine/threonine protein kinase
VIRLKQVEHVRNERNVLAAVAGHPFITTMVASFQDHDSLYMLVWCHCLRSAGDHWLM